MSDKSTSSVTKVHLEDGVDPKLDVALTIVRFDDDTRGVALMSYPTGEHFTITLDMLARVSKEVTFGSHEDEELDPAMVALARAEAGLR